MSFDDLLAANAEFGATFTDGYFDGIAKAGVALVTCMDSRIEPLRMLGLRLGDAKILRSPGGRVSAEVLTGCVLSVQLLQVNRIMIVPHTRCAMASGTDADIRRKIAEKIGIDYFDDSYYGSTHIETDADAAFRASEAARRKR